MDRRTFVRLSLTSIAGSGLSLGAVKRRKCASAKFPFSARPGPRAGSESSVSVSIITAVTPWRSV